jgi:hypothetical protein
MWMALRERVCAIDEINMAAMRMRLRHENEPPTDPPQPNIVEPAEVMYGFGCCLKSGVPLFTINVLVCEHFILLFSIMCL